MFRHLHHEHRQWHRRHDRYRRLGPIGRFVRARLHRRLFAWFAAGIIVTSFAVSGVIMLVARVQDSEWTRTVKSGQAWVGKQFARDWDDVATREAFARQTAAELDMNLELFDSAGNALLTVGSACGEHGFDVPVHRDGTRLGLVHGCIRHAPSFGWRWLVAMMVTVCMLWLASGKVARRLAKPLDELAEVVKKIGSGDLSARAGLVHMEADEIGVVAEAVNDMAGRIEKQMADQRELLATVSHELRTPLARVRIISEIARETGATEKTYDELDREVLEMDSLVGELLANSRIEFGALSIRDVSLRDVVGRAAERAGVDASKVVFEGTDDHFRADPTLVQRALTNVLDNTAKHGGGVDQLRASLTGGTVRVEVLDRGPGFTEEQRAQLFQKFRRSGTGRSEGLGLGLALVKRIAEVHGGTAWAVNREGGGAAVGFDLSAHPPEVPKTGHFEV
ncbi:MAG: HAMP domain-containing histidine kinase [Archangium sp.]|nr:HAMP domain-containing histidine kinase [Archangium sp.]